MPAVTAFCTILEARAAADDERVLCRGNSAGKEARADELVDRVVTPDVLERGDVDAIEAHERCGVAPSGLREERLALAEGLDSARDRGGRHPHVRLDRMASRQKIVD